MWKEVQGEFALCFFFCLFMHGRREIRTVDEKYARSAKNTHGPRRIRTVSGEYARSAGNTHGRRGIRTVDEKYARSTRNTHGPRRICTVSEKYAWTTRNTRATPKNQNLHKKARRKIPPCDSSTHSI